MTVRRCDGATVRRCAGAMVLVAAAVFLAAAPVDTQAQAKRPWPPVLAGPAPGEVELLPVRGQVYMITGAGANITVHAGEEGVLLVDTGTAAMADKVWAAVESIAKRKPLRYIINTTEQPDHVGGNAAIAPRGEIVPLRGRNYTAGPMGTIEYNKASVISYLSVLHRMSAPTGQTAPFPTVAWPDNTYSTPSKRFYFNHEAVVISHQPGNTDGNSIVLFRSSDVISTGDLLDLSGYPLIDVKAGGSIQSLVQTLNRLIEMSVPEAHAAGGTLVVPGHGRVADHAEVAYYRDMITIVRDRIQDGIKKKMTLEQIKASRPTRDYDPRYGRTSGPWTTDMFVEAAYRSLAAGTN